MTPEELRIVADDLQHVADWGPEISDGDIRRGSSVLRRLLVQDVYGKAWRSIGNAKQPKLVGVDISGLLADDLCSEIVFALAAGANFRGTKIACMILNRGSEPIGDFGLPLRDDGYPGEREFTLSEFLSSTSGTVDGETFTRSEVIKYIANVKGGVHLSSKLRKAEAKLVAHLGRIEKRISVHTTDGLLARISHR